MVSGQAWAGDWGVLQPGCSEGVMGPLGRCVDVEESGVWIYEESVTATLHAHPGAKPAQGFVPRHTLTAAPTPLAANTFPAWKS